MQNLAQSRADIVAQAVQILQREVAVNHRFPLAIPGVNPR
jgi:hypothetical protein